MPLAPPNTETSSAAPSAKHTRPPSEDHAHFFMDPLADAENEDDDDSEDQPLELRVRPAFSRPTSERHTSDPTPAPPQHDYLSVPGHRRSESRSSCTPPSPCDGQRNARQHVKAISRQLSNLAAEDAHFKRHRDSLELMRQRETMGERGQGINQGLVGTKDSFVLAKARVGKGKGKEKDGQRDLSPIVDASPPDSVLFLPSGGKRKGKGAEEKGGKVRKEQGVVGQGEEDRGGKGGAPLVGDDGEAHPDEHVHCPIYEVERPRWHEAKFGGRKLGT